jgi:hypothetical protein
VSRSAVKIPSPFPYFGSKAAAAPLIWSALGNPDNFVDPFSGSNSLLWLRPEPGKIETVNDAWGAIPNFLRAVKHAPESVADAASWTVDETMMHARHRWLVERMDEAFVERLMTDPSFFDAEIAGWWVWGQSIWIGAGWCSARFEREGLKRPILAGNGTNGSERPRTGVGIFRGRLPHLIGPHNARKAGGQLPHIQGSDGSGVGYGRGIFASGRREDLVGYFELLSDRLQRVRITCGDWGRVVTPAVTVSHGLTGVVLDPPYGTAANRTTKLYAVDSLDIADDVRRWAIDNGDNPLLRIVLCGYEGEHEMPSAWRKIEWKAPGGYGNQDGKNENASRERLWLSPHCLLTDDERPPAQGSLFAEARS